MRAFKGHLGSFLAILSLTLETQQKLDISQLWSTSCLKHKRTMTSSSVNKKSLAILSTILFCIICVTTLSTFKSAEGKNTCSVTPVDHDQSYANCIIFDSFVTFRCLYRRTKMALWNSSGCRFFRQQSLSIPLAFKVPTHRSIKHQTLDGLIQTTISQNSHSRIV